MAKITSSISGSTTTYTITDVAGNTATITAPPPPGLVAVASAGILADGQRLLDTLMQQLSTGLRPNVLPATSTSLSN